MSRPPFRPLFAVALAAVLAAGLLFPWPPGSPSPAEATPLYTARSGRACDNCHTDPSKWKNPKLAWRKCNLSCGTCHLSPTGGGLRNVSGRFYGQATLPMLGASHRPYKDWNRHVMRLTDYPKNRKNRKGELAFGKAPGGPARMAFDQDRYAGLNADPVLQAGIDMRLGLWFPVVGSTSALFFPMQLDLHLAIHPYRHITLVGTWGVLGKSQGAWATYGLGCRPEDPDATCHSRARDTFFMVKDFYAMLHHLPMAAYARVGRFIPPFGLMFDDHTLATRRMMELDGGILHSRVTGVEIGLAPNYPYAHLAVFKPNPRDAFVENPDTVSPDELPPIMGVDGWGAALSAGWRDLGFQIGASGMIRRRELGTGGNTASMAISFGVNPWYYLDWLPLTYLGEVVAGTRQRPSGETTWQVGMVHELSYLAFNGINFRLRYDHGDPDAEVKGDDYDRFSVGYDLYFLPGLGLTGMLRTQVNGTEGGSVTADYFMYLRGWY